MNADVTGLSKPAAAKKAIAQACAYIKTMSDMGKPVERVVLRKTDFDAIFRAINDSRDKMLPPLDGLRVGEVRLDRA